jgi:hypothetical protein
MNRNPLIPILICSAFSFSILAHEEPATEESAIEEYSNDDPFGDDIFNDQIKPVSKQADITKSYSITLEHFSLDLKESAKMLRLNLSSGATYKYLVEKSELEELAILKVSDDKATTESIREHIYPTEYEPPMEDTVNLSPVKIIPVTPTAFETRNTGFTAETKITLLDNGNYHLSCYSEFVKHTGNVEHGEAPVKATMPIFTTQRINYYSIIKLATPTILGTMSPPNKVKEDKSNKRIWFVVGTVKEVK